MNAHQERRDATYTAWANMLARTRGQNRPDADRYYERGATVCDRWDPRKGGSYAAFLADMGPRPSPLHSLDKDGIQEGNTVYGPGLCRWATRSEQAIARRNTRWIVFDNRRQCAQEWANEVGIARSTIVRRLKLGWSVEAALTTPVDHSRGRFIHAIALTYLGKTQSIAEWSKELGIHKSTLSWRLRHGWPIEKVLVR